MDTNFQTIYESTFTDPILKEVESVLYFIVQNYKSFIQDSTNTHEKISEFDKELGDVLERYKQLYNITSNITEQEMQLLISELNTQIQDIKTKLQSGYFKGDKGNPFLYSDFTPEQINSLKIKGDKGDPFVYSDFTPEQLSSLVSDRLSKITTPTTKAVPRIKPDGTLENSVMTIDDNGNTTIPLDMGNKIFKNIPVSGADYKHKYLILQKIPTFGNVNIVCSIQGKFNSSRSNSQLGPICNFEITTGYGNIITSRITNEGATSSQFVTVNKDGVDYIALYFYTAPNIYTSTFDGIVFETGTSQFDINFLTFYETDSALHSNVIYSNISTNIDSQLLTNIQVGKILEFGGNLPLAGAIDAGFAGSQYSGSITNMNDLIMVGKYNTMYNMQNIPLPDWGFVEVYKHSGIANSTDWVVQVWYSMGTSYPNRMFMRTKQNNSWTAWVEK